jgi:hypothetical protein
MFHLAIFRKVLVKFLLRRGDGLAGGIENDRAGTGGPLIDGEQVLGHGASFQGLQHYSGQCCNLLKGLLRTLR